MIQTENFCPVFCADHVKIIFIFVISNKIFRKGIGVNIKNHKTPTQSRSNFITKHFAVTARDIYPVFHICHSADKLFPSVNILNFIKKQVRPIGCAGKFYSDFQNYIQIVGGYFQETLVLEIDIYDLGDGNPLFYQRLDFLIHHIRFTGSSDSHKTVIYILL